MTRFILLFQKKTADKKLYRIFVFQIIIVWKNQINIQNFRT